MSTCPCGSGRAFETCCGPLLAGAPAPTAEALMRSRYTAFTRREFDYLENTHASEVKDDFNRTAAESLANEVTWRRLEVRACEAGGPSDETGTVEFVAHFSRHGQEQMHHELGTFRREDGHWVYVDGRMNPKAPPRQVNKVGRNDPCPCGSGKKYKKCCGA
jgi:SEC-C motif-containing protein